MNPLPKGRYELEILERLELYSPSKSSESFPSLVLEVGAHTGSYFLAKKNSDYNENTLIKRSSTMRDKINSVKQTLNQNKKLIAVSSGLGVIAGVSATVGFQNWKEFATEYVVPVMNET